MHIRSGHLATGKWQIKTQDGIGFLFHRLMFSPEPEFRIGSEDITCIDIENNDKNAIVVRISFSHNRYALAQSNQKELQQLQQFVNETNQAPIVGKKNQQPWVLGIVFVFFIATVYEFIK
jgi:hypothetical protein